MIARLPRPHIVSCQETRGGLPLSKRIGTACIGSMPSGWSASSPLSPTGTGTSNNGGVASFGGPPATSGFTVYSLLGGRILYQIFTASFEMVPSELPPKDVLAGVAGALAS
jgi:hypothetical protein